MLKIDNFDVFIEIMIKNELKITFYQEKRLFSIRINKNKEILNSDVESRIGNEKNALNTLLMYSFEDLYFMALQMQMDRAFENTLKTIKNSQKEINQFLESLIENIQK